MKKKNLLTLGALCLSLGLVVSACGEKGETGQTGPQGPQGEPGPAGKDGKTYVDVIVLNGEIQGGTVKQSTFFVTEGAHDSVTFTFTPENKSEPVAIEFEINGEVVADIVDPATNEYVLEDADTIAGSIQVTGVTFTSVDKYGESLVDDAVQELVNSDKTLDLVKKDGTTHFLTSGVKTNAYSDEAKGAVQEVYDDAIKAVADEVKDAKNEHKDDVKAQLDAVKTVAEAEIAKINEAYTQAVADAKIKAVADLETLSEVISEESYTDENREADKSRLQAKVEAATTIEGLGNVISGPATINNEGAGAEANKFYGAKVKAYAEVNAALDAVAEFTDELEDNTELETNLKVWGVDTSSLPTEVAETYFDKIAAAEEISIKKDSSNNLYTELGKEGADAVENSVLGIKDKVLEAVKTKYTNEINNSKVLEDQSSTKTALLSVLETAISNYDTADKDGTRFTIEQYVSEVVKPGTQVDSATKAIKTGDNTLGLIGYVEYCLAQPVNGSTNEAFQAERVENAKNDVANTLETARKAIVDTKYDAFAKYTTSGTTVTPTNKVLGTGAISKTVENPLFTWSGEEGSRVAALPTDVATGLVESVTVGTTVTSPNYNLDKWLENLKKAEIPTPESDTDEDGNWVGGTLSVQSWANSHTSDFKTIYVEGLGKIKEALNTSVESAIAASGLEADGYVSSTKVTESWDDLSTDPASEDYAKADEFVNTADSISENMDLLETLNEGINEFLEGKEGTDEEFAEYFGAADDEDSVSDTRKAFEDELAAVLAGTVSESSLKNWIRGLEDVYEDDVTAYLEEAKDIHTQAYQNKVVTTTTVTQARELKAAYDKYVSFVGHKVKEDTNGQLVIDDKEGTTDYTGKTITSVNLWLKDATNALTPTSSADQGE